MPETFPRLLTERETDVLRFLLSVDFAGRDALATQSETVQVTDRWAGEATIDLAVTADDAPLAEVAGRVPVETTTADDAFAVLLHVVAGRLHTLELVSQRDREVPELFPAPDELRPPY